VYERVLVILGRRPGLAGGMSDRATLDDRYQLIELTWLTKILKTIIRTDPD
jgi:hypothetical protein